MLACYGCKGFFRRTLTGKYRYACRFGNNCVVDKCTFPCATCIWFIWSVLEQLRRTVEKRQCDELKTPLENARQPFDQRKETWSQWHHIIATISIDRKTGSSPSTIKSLYPLRCEMTHLRSVPALTAWKSLPLFQRNRILQILSGIPSHAPWFVHDF